MQTPKMVNDPYAIAMNGNAIRALSAALQSTDCEERRADEFAVVSAGMKKLLSAGRRVSSLQHLYAGIGIDHSGGRVFMELTTRTKSSLTPYMPEVSDNNTYYYKLNSCATKTNSPGIPAAKHGGTI